MKKFKLFPILLCACLLFASAAPSAAALDEPELAAKYVVLADMDSGRILYSRNMTERTAPASLTKIMTILIAVEAIESGEIGADEIITAQSDCRVGMDEESSTSGIVPGEQMSLENLIYCAMLQSANEACNIIGTRLSGSISAFVERMNERAKLLGCTNTHFANTNGLTDPDHYTTAYDFYLLAREAVKHPMFMTVCCTDHYEVPATEMCGVRELDNSNALMSSGSIYGSEYLYAGTEGVKTGYTRAAGYCLISTCRREDIHVMAVVMGSTGVLNSDRQDYGNFVDSRALYDWGFESFAYKTILGTAPVERCEVSLAKDGETVSLCPSEEIRALLPKDVSESDIRVDVTVAEEKLVAPLAAGTELGEVRVSVRGESYGKVRLVSMNSVELSKIEYIKTRLRDTVSSGWFRTVTVILAVFVLIYIILVARYRAMRRRHMRERRLAEQRRRAERERRAAETPQRRPAPEPPTVRFTGEQAYDDGNDPER